MTQVRVTEEIAAPPEAVWAVLGDLAGHVSWMEDARAITFTTGQHTGVGTTFDCATVIGPIRFVDRMTVTEWDPPRALSIRHLRPVTGTGRITIERLSQMSSRVTWAEDLRLPWWLGGAVTGAGLSKILNRVWGRSLRNLARRVAERV